MRVGITRSDGLITCPICSRLLSRRQVANRERETGVRGAVNCGKCGSDFCWRFSRVEHLDIASAVVGFVTWGAGHFVQSWRDPTGAIVVYYESPPVAAPRS